MTYEGYKGYRPIITAFKELPLITQHEFREGNEMGRLVVLRWRREQREKYEIYLGMRERCPGFA